MDRTMRILGAILWSLGILVGGLLLLLFLMLPLFSAKDPFSMLVHMTIGAAIAFPACFVYLWVPVIVDRYDPEPWWALAMAFLWGAITACGFSGWINTINGEIALGILGKEGAEFVGAVISAPVFEEATKGIFVLGMLIFLRREFDGVVDGVIYATFVALGFAATENVLYYGRALQGGGLEALGVVVFLRGVLAPWGHPLYTSMIGLGVGIARETNSSALKFFAPVGGYCLAVGLHAIWNGTAVLSGWLNSGAIFLIMLIFWFFFLFAFGIIVILLVRREGQIIRKHLQDEVLLGNLSKEELELVCSPFGRLKALTGRGGSKAKRFVDAASRLGLSKWHAARAMQGKKMTISTDFIVPLRQELARLRAEIQGRVR
ncbi:MAG: PrsW family intramembrane metalloprotease [Myxococcales bacterium]|nr:PrsW family intramembrane metalloprotease [Polyangiaceae bacterium]MDW8248327.1 PrsW family intramembrane metalloprotease [Myxococcales bacterium]